MDPSKAAEANAELKEGQKQLTTSLMRWKPDYLAAEPCFQRAARGFKQAGLLDSAVAAWRQAADCAYRLGNVKQAAVTLEAASREMAVARDTPGKTEACRLMSDSAAYLQEAGEAVRSADLRLRAAKLAESFDHDLAVKLVDEVCQSFDGDDDKDVYAIEPLRKAMQMQMSLAKHASAMRTMDRLFKVWTRLDQKHNLYKLVLSRVVLLLAAADPVAAQQEFDKYLDMAGFAPTDEAAAAEDMIGAYTEMDVAAMKKILERNVFGFLEHAVTNVARKIPDGMEAGAVVGGSKAGESASLAVTTVQRAPGEFRSFGTGTVAAPGSSAGAGGGGGGGRPEVEEREDEATVRARKAADKDYALRASLFSRPAGAGASASSSSAAVPSTAAADGGADGEGDAFGEADDIDAAFATMALGPDGLPLTADRGATNAAAGAEGEEDLGLL